MNSLIQFMVGIFKAIFGTMMKHPVEEKEKVNDVGRKQPENPDDAFSKSDF
jgi:hypothetical protein